MQSNLTSVSISDSIKEICLEGQTGTLIVSHQETVKELLFENGVFVGALSTDPSEELGEWLVTIGQLSPADLDAAVTRDPSRQLLSRVLIEMGLFDGTQMAAFQANQAQEIFCSIFNWENPRIEFKPGNIFLDEVQKLSLSVRNLIFQAIQRMNSTERIRREVGGGERLIRLSAGAETKAVEIDLRPEEAFILSRIESLTSVADILQLSPLGLEKTERALYGFFAAGIIEFVTKQAGSSRTSTSPQRANYRASEPAPSPLSEEEAESPLSHQKGDEVRSDIFMMLDAVKTKNYYDLLSIQPAANADEIKKSYYALAKKYHPDRYERSMSAEIKEALETIFSTLSQAYETLKVPATRTSYDAKIFKLDSASSVAERPSGSNSSAAGPGQQKLAELNYRQGRGYFEQEDYWNSVQAFRQSVRLEPVNARYRFWLGMALAKNPKWRREAEEHLLKAIEIDQFKAEYSAALGTLYKEVGLKKRAQSQFSRALQLEPDNVVALEGLQSLSHTSNKKTPFDSFKKLLRFKK